MKHPLRILMICLVAVGVITAAKGAAIMTFGDGGVDPTITVTDNGPGDLSSSAGVMVVQTNIGVWVLSISTAITKPAFGSSTDPLMDINIQADSVGAGILTLTFSDNNFGPASGILTSVATGQLVVGGASTLSYDVYGDPGNVVGGTTVHLTSVGPVNLGTLGSVSDSGPLTLGTPFSLTQVVTFDATGPAEVDADSALSVTPVPEPGILSLSALGLVACVLRRRMSNKSRN